ncbi:MAG: hypothetical protein ACE5JL_03515 [Dehalococcoidia bacterium]
MTDEELTALQEELAAARAEAERLSEAAADRQARAAHLEEVATALRQDLTSAQAELVEARDQLIARDQELATVQDELAEARTEATTAALKYRDAILAAEPWLPADMVAGDTVAQIDEALDKARRTVVQVRQHLEEQAQQARVPTGAPPRRPPDLSSLSPLEKVKLGLQQRAERLR